MADKKTSLEKDEIEHIKQYVLDDLDALFQYLDDRADNPVAKAIADKVFDFSEAVQNDKMTREQYLATPIEGEESMDLSLESIADIMGTTAERQTTALEKITKAIESQAKSQARLAMSLETISETLDAGKIAVVTSKA